jgi:hypothetical protein
MLSAPDTVAVRLAARIDAVVLLGSLAACGQESSTPTATDEPTPDHDSGRGGPGWADEGGDLVTALDWTTTSDSTETSVARGEVGLLGPPPVYEDRELEGYGPSLSLTGLAEEPSQGTADVLLSDGSASATYPMKLSRRDSCPGDGAVSFSGDAMDESLDLPALGDPPYSYEVHLTMDGRSYTGTGRWPDDLKPPNANSLALTWSPPLPAWDGS